MIRSPPGAAAAFRRKPRASGDDPATLPTIIAPAAVNPARAGMIPSRSVRTVTLPRKPRASGDDPQDDDLGQVKRQ